MLIVKISFLIIMCLNYTIVNFNTCLIFYSLYCNLYVVIFSLPLPPTLPFPPSLPLSLLDKISSTSQPLGSNVVKNDPEILIFLPPYPEYQDYQHLHLSWTVSRVTHVNIGQVAHTILKHMKQKLAKKIYRTEHQSSERC